MKKRTIVLMVAIFVGTIALCAWVFHPLISLQSLIDSPVSDDIKLKICGSYGVPGMFQPDVKGGEAVCNVLETDSYGRILFEYTATSMISHKKETALVVCQKHDDNFVYYYEDRCYYLGDSSEEAILALKTKNDWNKELNHSKLSKREVNVSYDLFLITAEPFGWDEVQQSFCKHIQINTSQLKDHSILDATENGELHWMEFERDGAKETGYFLITKSKCAFLKAEKHISPEELAAFKKSNGWES